MLVSYSQTNTKVDGCLCEGLAQLNNGKQVVTPCKKNGSSSEPALISFYADQVALYGRVVKV